MCLPRSISGYDFTEARNVTVAVQHQQQNQQQQQVLIIPLMLLVVLFLPRLLLVLVLLYVIHNSQMSVEGICRVMVKCLVEEFWSLHFENMRQLEQPNSNQALLFGPDGDRFITSTEEGTTVRNTHRIQPPARNFWIMDSSQPNPESEPLDWQAAAVATLKPKSE